MSYKSRYFRLFTGKKLTLLGLLFRIQESIPFIFPQALLLRHLSPMSLCQNYVALQYFFPRGQSQIIYDFFQPLSDIEQVTKVRVT